MVEGHVVLYHKMKWSRYARICKCIQSISQKLSSDYCEYAVHCTLCDFLLHLSDFLLFKGTSRK